MTDSQLYFIRHGIATERGGWKTDVERPLTPEGNTKTYHVAQRLKALGIQFKLIQTSPLIRAKQTAEIFDALGLSLQVLESIHLMPSGHLQDWLTEWQGKKFPDPMAVIGHEPNLSLWAELLVFGHHWGRLKLKKTGVIGLNVPSSPPFIGRCHLFWLTSPKLLI